MNYAVELESDVVRLPPPVEDPDMALNKRGDVWMSQSKAIDIVTAMASDATTARLNRHQRWALLIVLGILNRSERIRADHRQELVATHAERKRLRKALDDMRQERDRERKRADRAESQKNGRPGCGKVPLGNAAEAHMFIQLRCAETGEDYNDYATYICERGCEPMGRMAGVWHIGHVISRAERERRAAAERN